MDEKKQQDLSRLGIISSSERMDLYSQSECDDIDDCDTEPGPSDCECSDCVSCVG